MMMQCMDCIHEVESLYAEKWQPNGVAQGENWLEIEWISPNSESQLMMVYGKKNIAMVEHLLHEKTKH